MSIKRIIILSLVILLVLSAINADEFKDADNLYHKGKYKDGLNVMLKMHDKNNPDSKVVWRISRFYFEIAGEMSDKDKKAKINKFEQGINFTKPYLAITNGDKRDRAQVVFWYAASLGSRGEVIGIKESLDTVPVLFKLADRAISIDPSFPAPYLLKGRIDDAVPGFLGGDKFRMGINFSKAVQYDNNDLNILVDAANAFIKRNWDEDKKKKEASKKGKTDGTPQNMADKEYAKKLLNQAVSVYNKIKDPGERDTKKYKEALKLLKKIS